MFNDALKSKANKSKRKNVVNKGLKNQLIVLLILLKALNLNEDVAKVFK